MLEAEFRFRLNVSDAADRARTTFQLKDQFLNYAFSDQLKVALKDLTTERINRGVREFIVDLSAVNMMDSCGLSVLIGMRKLVETAQGRMVVVTPSPIILRLFAITRLDRVFELVANEEEAAAAFERPVPQSA